MPGKSLEVPFQLSSPASKSPGFVAMPLAQARLPSHENRRSGHRDEVAPALHGDIRRSDEGPCELARGLAPIWVRQTKARGSPKATENQTQVITRKHANVALRMFSNVVLVYILRERTTQVPDHGILRRHRGRCAIHDERLPPHVQGRARGPSPATRSSFDTTRAL